MAFVTTSADYGVDSDEEGLDPMYRFDATRDQIVDAA